MISSRGIIYLSRVPPYMKPEKVRHLMSKYGKVGKLFLKEEDPSSRKRRVQTGGSRKKYYIEGEMRLTALCSVNRLTHHGQGGLSLRTSTWQSVLRRH